MEIEQNPGIIIKWIITMKYIYVFIIMFGFACKSNKNEVIISQYPNGTIKHLALYEDKKKTKEIIFYENGKKEKEINFNDSIRHGNLYFWYLDGTLKADYRYERGLKEGVSKEFNINGTIDKEIVYEKGKMIIYSRFYPTGIKRSEINTKEKKSFFWYKNGQLEAEIPSNNDSCKYFYNNGSKKEFGYLKEGKEQSIWQYWDEKGLLMKKITWDKGIAIDSVIFSK